MGIYYIQRLKNTDSGDLYFDVWILSTHNSGSTGETTLHSLAQQTLANPEAEICCMTYLFGNFAGFIRVMAYSWDKDSKTHSSL